MAIKYNTTKDKKSIHNGNPREYTLTKERFEEVIRKMVINRDISFSGGHTVFDKGNKVITRYDRETIRYSGSGYPIVIGEISENENDRDTLKIRFYEDEIERHPKKEKIRESLDSVVKKLFPDYNKSKEETSEFNFDIPAD